MAIVTIVITDMSKQQTTVQFSKELTEALKALGHKGETYEDVVWRLIKGYRGGGKTKSG